MHDALEELAELSEALQKDDITLATAIGCIRWKKTATSALTKHSTSHGLTAKFNASWRCSRVERKARGASIKRRSQRLQPVSFMEFR